LNKRNWPKKEFGQFVFNISERVEPGNTSLEKYIGLEHLDAGKIKIERFGKPEDVIGTKLKIYKGDIIFGKRRAYLRKAAVADFDGICSAHSMVLRANEKEILKDFLPNFLHSDIFMNRAVEISEGSLSPTIKWKTLAKQEFLLPPLEEQHRIAELFQSIEQSITQAEEQERKLKSLQKSLSNGLVDNPPVFGNLLTAKNCKPCSVGDISDCIEQHDKKPLENGITRFIGLENIEPENFNLQGFGNIKDGTTFTKRFSKGDVLFGKRRPYLKKVAVADFDGICSGDILVFRAKENKMLPEFLPYYVSSEAFEIFVPDIKTQEKIVDIFIQLNDSLKLITRQKSTLKNLKQKLLNEILG